MYKTSWFVGWLVWGFGALMLLVGSAAVSGTTVLKQDVGELADRAPLIFIGTAVDRQPGVLEKIGYPASLVTFRVEELFKGIIEGTELTLAFEGGELGGEIFEVIGMPSFEVGEKYLLFVRNNGDRGGCPVLGWRQGKLDFLSHPFTGVEMLVDYRGAPVLGLEEEDWLVAPVSMSPSGYAEAAASVGVELIAEEGVVISGLGELESLAERAWSDVPAAQSVVDSIRSFFQHRRGSEAYLPGSFISSIEGKDLLSSKDLAFPMRATPVLPTSLKSLPQARGAAGGGISSQVSSVPGEQKESSP